MFDIHDGTVVLLILCLVLVCLGFLVVLGILLQIQEDQRHFVWRIERLLDSKDDLPEIDKKQWRDLDFSFIKSE